MNGPSGTLTPAINRVRGSFRLMEAFGSETTACLSLTISSFIGALLFALVLHGTSQWAATRGVLRPRRRYRRRCLDRDSPIDPTHRRRIDEEERVSAFVEWHQSVGLPVRPVDCRSRFVV